MDDERGPAAPGAAPTEILPPYGAPAAVRRRPGGVVGVAVGVVAALVATCFAVVSLTAGDGSASPEEAVERLLGATADEDLIGVLESLTPGERSALLPGIEGIADQLQRIGILGDDLDLGGLGGIDIEVEGLTLASEELGTGVSAVRITGGTITVGADPAALPLSPDLRRLVEDEAGDDLEPSSSTEDLADADATIVAVDHGDGWHVSLFYSVAEAIRAGTDQPVPAFGAGIRPDGAASPEDAVREAVEAATELDLRRVIALLAPDEMRVLHDYAPLFLDEVEAELVEARETTDITVDRLELDSEVDGATARVTVSEFAFSGEISGEPFEVDFDGDCVTATSDAFTGDEWVPTTSSAEPYAGSTNEEVCLSDLIEEGGPGAGFLGTQTVVTVVERDGAWYLSPVRTGFEGILTLLGSIEDDALADVDSLEDLLWSVVFGGGMNPLAGMGGPSTSEYRMGDGESGEWDEGELDWDTEDWDTEDWDEEWPADGGVEPPRPDAGSGPAAGVDELPMSAVDECWAPIDDLPPGAGSRAWEDAEVLVDECLAGLGR